MKQQSLRCTTAATILLTITALLLGWTLLGEENTAMHRAQQAEGQSQMQHEATQACWGRDELNGPGERMVAEVSVDLLYQQPRGHYTAARYRACLPQLQRFLCVGHRKRSHLSSLICRWYPKPAVIS